MFHAKKSIFLKFITCPKYLINCCLHSLLQRRGSHLSIKNLDIKDIKVRILSEFIHVCLVTHVRQNLLVLGELGIFG